MSKQAKRFYEFGPFRLDTANRLLMRESEVVPLKQKAVETLLVLVEGRGEVLEKDELMRRLWPDSFVEESNLTQNIYTLRKALGAADYIETVPRRGYRFAAEVREWEEESAELILRESTRSKIIIEEEETREQADAEEVGARPEAEKLTRARAEVSAAGRTKVLTAGRTRRRAFVFVLAGALVLAAALGVASYRGKREGPARAPLDFPIRSIAVVPFKSLGADEGDAYAGVGMADTLITKLSAAGRLVVRPTSAVLKYADAGQDSLKAGRELGVDCVLDGSIQRQDGRLRVNVRLIRTSDGRALWAEKFDEQPSGVFALQDSISERVADALALRLSGEEQKLLAKRYTDNPEAYQLYLQGRYFWNKRTDEGLKKSVEYFQRAVELDPAYALAYTGLADAYIQLPAYGSTASMEVYPKAKAAAARALALDETLAEAHNSEAGVLSYFEWDWPAAEAEYRRAIALNPNYASAHQRLGVQLAATGRPEEALTELKRAQELDPLSLIINSLVGFADLQTGRQEEAAAQLRRVVEMDRSFPPAHEFLAHVYEGKGEADEAFAEYLEWRRLSGDGDEKLAAYRKAYAASGLRGFYRRRLDFLLAEPGRVEPTEVARLYALAGEREQALAWLERAVEQHEGEAVWLKVLPEYEGLRSDPRFAELLKRVNLDK